MDKGTYRWRLETGQRPSGPRPRIANAIFVPLVPRPLPAVVFLSIFGLYLLGGVRTEQRRGALTAVAAWGGPVAIAFAVAGWYNWVRFGTPFDGGQSRIGAATFSTPLMTGVVGQLFSPGKSLFLFSPPLLVGLAGLPAFMRKNFGLGVVIVGAAAINIAFYGRYYEWAGDYAWGARYIVPLTGLLLLPAVAVLSRWRSLPLFARAGIIVSAVAGFAIQVLGVSIDYLHQMLRWSDSRVSTRAPIGRCRIRPYGATPWRSGRSSAATLHIRPIRSPWTSRWGCRSSRRSTSGGSMPGSTAPTRS
jgi:hypothetical protein